MGLIKKGVVIVSSMTTKKVTCPKCGAESEIKVYKTVNPTTDPAYREQLLNGELLKFTCDKCGGVAQLRYPLLYNDMKNNFMVYYIPEIDRETLTDEVLEREYGDLEGITRRLVPGYNELKEKIHIFEANLDDKVIEVVKAALKDVVEKRTGEEVTGGYFSKYSVAEDRIGFTFFVGDEGEQFVQTTRLEIYNKSAAVAAAEPADPADRQFFLIDRTWARSALYKYKKSKAAM